MSDPSFRLADDRRHVIWEHDCLVTWTIDPLEQEQLRQELQIPLNPEHGWTVTSTDPLTVTPSLLCTGCGTHGFITDGKWISV